MKFHVILLLQETLREMNQFTVGRKKTDAIKNIAGEQVMKHKQTLSSPSLFIRIECVHRAVHTITLSHIHESHFYVMN